MTRPWKLVAPWYYWQRQVAHGLAATPRDSRPVVQKFDRPNFVDGLLKEPQRSLQYDDDDFVYTYSLINAELTSGPLNKYFTSLFRPKLADGSTSAKRSVPTRTGVRKLFLDTCTATLRASPAPASTRSARRASWCGAG
jgi:hypothetical protein